MAFLKLKKKSLTRNIFVGMLLGLICGLAFNLTGLNQLEFVTHWLTGGLFSVMGQVFIRGIKMLVVPLVFFSIAAGTASMTDIRKLGRIGSRILLFYMATTVMAITIALCLGNLIDPNSRPGGLENPQNIKESARLLHAGHGGSSCRS